MKRHRFALALMLCVFGADYAHALCSAAPTGSTQDTAIMMMASGSTAGIGPVANVSSTNEGVFVYDSTNDLLKYCNGTSWVSLSSGGGATVAGSTGDIQFNNAGALAADTGQLYWDATNNRLGIGTSTPAYKLDVNGDMRAAGTVLWGASAARTETKVDAGAIASKSGFFETAAPTNYYSGASGWQHLIEARHSNDTNNYALQLAGSFFDQELYFRKTNNSASTAWSKVIAANSSGNVAIGTSSPNARLDVSGSIVSRAYNNFSGTSIDFSQGNVVYTSAACGAFTLTNIADGGAYTLVTTGSGIGPASFTHTGLTVKTSATLTCTSAKHTVFSFVRAGSNVYVTMISGF